jgi:hypothetical protein
MEIVVIFYDHLEYFTASWYNFWPFGIVCGQLVYFLRFGMFGPRKIWQPCTRLLKACFHKNDFVDIRKYFHGTITF